MDITFQHSIYLSLFIVTSEIIFVLITVTFLFVLELMFETIYLGKQYQYLGINAVSQHNLQCKCT